MTAAAPAVTADPASQAQPAPQAQFKANPQFPAEKQMAMLAAFSQCLLLEADQKELSERMFVLTERTRPAPPSTPRPGRRAAVAESP